MRTPIAGLRGHVAVALTGIAVAVAFLLTLLYLGHGLPSTKRAYEVKAILPTSAALTPGARVTMAGADVGTVRSVERRGAGALVTLRIGDDRVTPLPQDSRVQLRARTPVGENYIAVKAGRSARKLPAGDTLPMSAADEYVDVDQILTVLQGKARAHARELIQGLGGGLRGRGPQLHTLIGQSAQALSDGAQVASVLAHDRRQLAQLVEQLGDVTRAVGDRGAAVRRLASSGLTTMRALAGRDAALRSLLDELPASLRQVRSTARRVDSVTGRAAPVLADLAVAVRQIRPAVRRLRPAAVAGQSAVSELGAAAPALRGTLQRVSGLGAPAGAALPAVRDALCQLDPVIRYAKPYTDDVISALGGLGSAANAYDALGHTIRLTAIVSDDSLVGAPADVSAAAQTLLHAGFMAKSSGLSWDPYPKPGQIGKSSAAGQSILGPDALGASGYKYPRILADC
jgi:phospholipid/cholesterol/gamma-HCH transport system substrate-binding protein